MAKKSVWVNFKTEEKEITITNNCTFDEFTNLFAYTFNADRSTLLKLGFIHYGETILTQENLAAVEDGDNIVVVYMYVFLKIYLSRN